MAMWRCAGAGSLSVAGMRAARAARETGEPGGRVRRGRTAEMRASAPSMAGGMEAGSMTSAVTVRSRGWAGTARRAGSRTTAVTSWPAASAWLVRQVPVAPVAPRMVSFIVFAFPGSVVFRYIYFGSHTIRRSYHMESILPGDAGAAPHHGRLNRAIKESLRQLGPQLSLLNHSVGARLDLKAADLECLDLITRYGPLSPSALARRAGLHPATMTGILDRLERGGWIERGRDPPPPPGVVIQAPPRRRAA